MRTIITAIRNDVQDINLAILFFLLAGAGARTSGQGQAKREVALACRRAPRRDTAPNFIGTILIPGLEKS
jgi:hypothetical protein